MCVCVSVRLNMLQPWCRYTRVWACHGFLNRGAIMRGVHQFYSFLVLLRVGGEQHVFPTWVPLRGGEFVSSLGVDTRRDVQNGSSVLVPLLGLYFCQPLVLFREGMQTYCSTFVPLCGVCAHIFLKA